MELSTLDRGGSRHSRAGHDRSLVRDGESNIHRPREPRATKPSHSGEGLRLPDATHKMSRPDRKEGERSRQSKDVGPSPLNTGPTRVVATKKATRALPTALDRSNRIEDTQKIGNPSRAGQQAEKFDAPPVPPRSLRRRALDTHGSSGFPEAPPATENASGGSRLQSANKWTTRRSRSFLFPDDASCGRVSAPPIAFQIHGKPFQSLSFSTSHGRDAN